MMLLKICAVLSGVGIIFTEQILLNFHQALGFVVIMVMVMVMTIVMMNRFLIGLTATAYSAHK